MRLIYFLGYILIISACQNPQQPHSLLFQQIFIVENSLFRGAELGMEIEEIQQIEQTAPRSQDLLGLTFAYVLADSQQLYVEYYNGLAENGQPQDQVQAILANIFLSDELIAAELYQEILLFFTDTFGLSEGEFGQDRWQGETADFPIEVRLKLNADQRSLSISFIALEK